MERLQTSFKATSPSSHLYINAALEYAARGWSVIPTRGKKAAGLWKPFQLQRPDEKMLRSMFARPNITGLAVILGSVSGGLACRDYDRADAYQRWAADHPELTNILPTVQTSRGYHVYFAGPEGFTKLDDGEYRATSGHYCLLPPSAHPDGGHYRWLVPLAEGKLLSLDPANVGLDCSERQAVTQGTQVTQAVTQATTQTNPANTLHVLTDEIQAAIEATLPNGPGQRNRLLFDLARQLKSIMPNAAITELEPIVREWYSRALAVICTKEWLDSWIDFRTAWVQAKKPVGATMATIVAAAQSSTPGDADAIAKLTALCRELQAHHGAGRAWPLSCRLAAKHIGLSHVRAAKLLKMLTLEGVLELASPGGRKGSKQAAEYRFLGGKS